MSTLTTQSNFFIRNLLIGHLKVIVNSAQSTGHFINNIPINCNSWLCPLEGHEVPMSSILKGGGAIWCAEIFRGQAIDSGYPILQRWRGEGGLVDR
jgi:hypothetical protein